MAVKYEMDVSSNPKSAPRKTPAYRKPILKKPVLYRPSRTLPISTGGSRKTALTVFLCGKPQDDLMPCVPSHPERLHTYDDRTGKASNIYHFKKEVFTSVLYCKDYEEIFNKSASVIHVFYRESSSYEDGRVKPYAYLGEGKSYSSGPDSFTIVVQNASPITCDIVDGSAIVGSLAALGADTTCATPQQELPVYSVDVGSVK
jgi:hypothetical protein